MKKEQKIREKIENLKQKLTGLGDMRPGSLTRQVRSWGKEYWQISYTHKGRGRTGYVSNENYKRVKQETENYKIFRAFCAELIDLYIELGKLTDKETDS